MDEYTIEQLLTELRKRMDHCAFVGVPPEGLLGDESDEDGAYQIMMTYGGDMIYVLGLLEHATAHVHANIRKKSNYKDFDDDEDEGEGWKFSDN